MWPFKKKLPHEVLPEILEWQVDDNVEIEWKQLYFYMGCDGESLIFRSQEHPYPLKRYSAKSLNWKPHFKNKSYVIRKASEDYFATKTALLENCYNEFLQIQAKYREELLSSMGLLS